MKKILIITPRSPFEDRGADEQDRLTGILWWVSKGYDVRVVTKIFPNDLTAIENARREYGITIHAIPYKYAGKKSLLTILKRVLVPRYWDGAAFEYFDPEIQNMVRDELEWGPDLVWVDYTYLWPLYPSIVKAGIPIITRSINYEPEHFLDEDGRSLVNTLKAYPKRLSEKKALRNSSWFFSITPKEEEIYKTLGATPVRTLPLRALPSRLIGRSETAHMDVRIGFMPSTYTVHHNKEALRFIVEDVWPLLPEEIRKRVSIHVTGNKFPKDIVMPPEIVHEGFVPSSIEFWKNMDIALSPSLFGAGMQQKIFEPITLGVPTITSERGLVGYPLVCGTHLLCAETKEEVGDAIIRLAGDPALRRKIGSAAQDMTKTLFAQVRYDGLLEEALARLHI